MTFFLLSILFMFIGRKIGWLFSRIVLYQTRASAALIFAALWAALVAFAMRGLINVQQPGAVLRWIFGYSLGAYVAIPNYGLVDRSTLPPDVERRDTAISNLAVLVYIGLSITFAYVIPPTR